MIKPHLFCSCSLWRWEIFRYPNRTTDDLKKNTHHERWNSFCGFEHFFLLIFNVISKPHKLIESDEHWAPQLRHKQNTWILTSLNNWKIHNLNYLCFNNKSSCNWLMKNDAFHRSSYKLTTWNFNEFVVAVVIVVVIGSINIAMRLLFCLFFFRMRIITLDNVCTCT